MTLKAEMWDFLEVQQCFRKFAKLIRELDRGETLALNIKHIVNGVMFCQIALHFQKFSTYSLLGLLNTQWHFSTFLFGLWQIMAYNLYI